MDETRAPAPGGAPSLADSPEAKTAWKEIEAIGRHLYGERWMRAAGIHLMGTDDPRSLRRWAKAGAAPPKVAATFWQALRKHVKEGQRLLLSRPRSH